MTKHQRTAVYENLETSSGEFFDIFPEFVKFSRSALICRGIIFIIMAILMLNNPLQAVSIIVMVFGFYALFEGIFLFSGALSLPSNVRTILLLNGCITIFLGLAAITCPWLMGEYAIIFLGAWQIINAIQCFMLIKYPRHRWKNLLAGVFAGLTGIVFIMAPFQGLLAVSWVFILLFFISGVMMLINGIAMHKIIR